MAPHRCGRFPRGRLRRRGPRAGCRARDARSVDRPATSAEGEGAQAVRAGQDRGQTGPARCVLSRQRQAHPLASVHPERVFGRRVHAGCGVSRLRQPEQFARLSRQLLDRGVQEGRGGVPRPARAARPRPVLGPRRVARGDPGRVLRHRHGRDVGRRSRQLRLRATVRVGHGDRAAAASIRHGRGRGVLTVEAGAGFGRRALDRDRL